MNIQHPQIKMTMANSIYPTKLANRERHNETYLQKMKLQLVKMAWLNIQHH